MKEIPEIYKSLPSGEVNYLLHRMKAKLIRRDVLSVIKLGNSSFSRDRIQGNKRGKKNRYDKFSRNFYNKVQKAFIKISSSNKNRYVVLDNSKDSNDIEKIILNKVLSRLKK